MKSRSAGSKVRAGNHSQVHGVAMKCRACDVVHPKGVARCEQAARILGAVPSVANKVANAKPRHKTVANKVANKVANRHGKYADLPRRRAYMAGYMAAERAIKAGRASRVKARA